GVSSGRSANQTANGRCWGLHSPIIPSFFQCVCELVHTYAGTLERRKSQSQPKPALGQKQTCAVQNVVSALHPIATAKAKFGKSGHVCFTPESGHVRCNGGCPLWAKSGHPAVSHSITSSARPMRVLGTVMPSALAVLRF